MQEVTPQLAEQLELDADDKGVIVTDVELGSPGFDAGMQRGNLIREVNRRAIKGLADYTRVIQRVGKSQSLLLHIKRGESSLYVVLKRASNE